MSSREHQTRAAVGGRSTGRRPTVDDVARLAGVSRQTVSRVVNSSGPVSLRTRERVESAVTELGYAPDPTAQNLGRYRRAQPPPSGPLSAACVEAIGTLRAAGLVVQVRRHGTAVAVDVELPAPPPTEEGHPVTTTTRGTQQEQVR